MADHRRSCSPSTKRADQPTQHSDNVSFQFRSETSGIDERLIFRSPQRCVELPNVGLDVRRGEYSSHSPVSPIILRPKRKSGHISSGWF